MPGFWLFVAFAVVRSSRWGEEQWVIIVLPRLAQGICRHCVLSMVVLIRYDVLICKNMVTENCIFRVFRGDLFHVLLRYSVVYCNEAR